MSPELWLAFVAASLPVHFAPGPNNILALSYAMARGYRAGHLASLGRYPAYLLIFLAAGFGLGALLTASPALFAALKWIGALYLAWIGWRMLRSAGAVGSGGAPARAETPDFARALRGEFLVAIANPKAVIFATAFYAQFVTPGQDGFARLFAQMVALSLTLECLAAGCYAFMGAGVAGAAGRGRILAVATRALGALMIVFALLLAFA